MYEFLSLKLKNVAMYDGLDLSLEVEEGRSAILIRGHSDHGKTMLFRALTWTVFGKDGIEQLEASLVNTSLRRFDAKGEQTHKGTLEFRNDTGARFRLRREAVTTGPDDTVDERVWIDRHNPASENPDGWDEDANLAEQLKEFYFPPELAPYLFINDDRVKDISGDAVRGSNTADKITRAIDDMLGVTAVRKAAERAKAQGDVLHQEWMAMVGPNTQTTELTESKTKAELDLSQATDTVEDLEKAVPETEEALRQKKEELQEEEAKVADRAPFEERAAAQTRFNDAALARADAARPMREAFSSSALLLPMFFQQLSLVSTRLGQLKKDGVIPQSELKLIEKLLNEHTNPDQKCVCEQVPVTPGSPAYDVLTEKVAHSKGHESGSNRLDHILTDLDNLITTQKVSDSWWDEFTGLMKITRTRNAELDTARELLEGADRVVAGMQEDDPELRRKIDSLRTEISDLNHQLRNLRERLENEKRRIAGGVNERTSVDYGRGLAAQVLSAQRALSSHVTSQRDGIPLRLASQAAQQVHEALTLVVKGIHDNQVPNVSDEVNELFLTMTNNKDLSDSSDPNAQIATGSVQIASPRSGVFELIAETKGGDPKPLGSFNGASRRALTVAFMVALLRHSQAPIPMVTDSLFHTVNGDVKVKLAQQLLGAGTQKIVFFFHDDVTNPKVCDALMDEAAKTYTVVNSSKPADLMKPPTWPAGHAHNSVIMVCECSPREHCDTCELKEAPAGLTHVAERRVL